MTENRRKTLKEIKEEFALDPKEKEKMLKDMAKRLGVTVEQIEESNKYVEEVFENI